MKYLLSLFLIIAFSHNVFSQLLEDEDIILPWTVVYVEDCEGIAGDGILITNDDRNLYTTYKDQIVYEDNGECKAIIRKHILFDWDIAEADSSFIQIIKYSPSLTLNVKETVIIKESDAVDSLEIKSLIIDPKDDHVYSFRMDTVITAIPVDLDLNQSKSIYIYDWTEQTAKQSKVHFVQCESEPIVTTPDTVEVIFNKEHYIPFDLDFLGIDIDYACADYTIDIRAGNLPFIALASDIGKVKEYKVTVKFQHNDPIIIKRKIYLKITGEKPDPFNVYIEDKEFVAGETVEVDIWSDAIDNAAAWLFSLSIKNGKYISVEAGDNFEDAGYNILNDTESRVLWVSEDAQPVKIEKEDDWSILTIRPDFSGNTKDLFDLTQVYDSQLTLQDETTIYSHKIDFNFNFGNKGTTSNNEIVDAFPFVIYPNPVEDRLYIQLDKKDNKPEYIEIYNQMGQLISTQDFNNTNDSSISVASMPSGVYTLFLKGNKKQSLKKFVKR